MYSLQAIAELNREAVERHHLGMKVQPPMRYSSGNKPLTRGKQPSKLSHTRKASLLTVAHIVLQVCVLLALSTVIMLVW